MTIITRHATWLLLTLIPSLNAAAPEQETLAEDKITIRRTDRPVDSVFHVATQPTKPYCPACRQHCTDMLTRCTDTCTYHKQLAQARCAICCNCMANCCCDDDCCDTLRCLCFIPACPILFIYDLCKCCYITNKDCMPRCCCCCCNCCCCCCC